MSIVVDEYLKSIKSNLRMESKQENEIISELSTHIEDEVQELKKHGLHDEEAIKTSLSLLGSAKSVARQIYEAHSQGSWQQALMASLPHILFGLVFFLNWWRGIGSVLLMLILLLSTTVYGWWHRRSTWLFPWLGYSLLPVVAAGLSLLYLPRSYSWIAIIIYLPLAIWLILRIVSQTIKSDWMYVSLMLLPIPIIISWFLVAQWRGSLDSSTLERLTVYGPSIGVSFLALAFGVVAFIRTRRRWLKISVLFLTGIITLGLIFAYAWGTIDLTSLLLLILLLVSLFLIPALLQNGVRSGKWGKFFENHPMQ
jgi:hypothetical protein